jgi:hypothetical protein
VFHLGTTVLYVDTSEQTSRKIALAVSQALTDAGISQRSAAEQSGIPLTTLSRRLTGASPFLITELAVLARMLNTTVGALTTAAEARDSAA